MITSLAIVASRLHAFVSRTVYSPLFYSPEHTGGLGGRRFTYYSISNPHLRPK